MKKLIIVVLAILVVSCTQLTPEQKISALETKQAKQINDFVGPEACSDITATTKASSTIGVDVLGTFTNNCEKKIRYAEIEVACFDSSGKLLEMDTEYVTDIKPGQQAYFKSLFMSSPEQINKCKIKIIESDY